MQILLKILKIFINIILFCFYGFVSIFIGNFFYGFYLVKRGLPVPGAQDFSHIRLAVFILLLVFIFTILLRKFFYLRVFKK